MAGRSHDRRARARRQHVLFASHIERFKMRSILRGAVPLLREIIAL